MDRFQRRAFDLLDDGKSVLVAAPTGSGKTLIAEYAVARALADRGRAIYTTPLKALSNQKYGDFAREYEPARVGLLTGDVSRNGNGDVVVMTTEVLRNMIYAQSPGLERLQCVILDEVHYLEDRYRGAVWEEIILSAPPSVTLVCLSATVSNAEELAGWIENVRGSMAHVIEEHRPIELKNLYVVGVRATRALAVMPTFVDGLPNKEAIALDDRSRPKRALRRNPTPTGQWRGARSGPRSPLYRPRRYEVVERFAEDNLLPAIYFVFSRAGCDDAVRQCREAGLRLTTPDERRQIRAIAEDHVEALSDDDLRVLNYGSFLEGLEEGFAAHHAGLVPAFRETVEELFSSALVKVVFSTETLALGINMPARSVVIESLSKFSGAGHEDLSAGNYTQLTGRAGRRGIDPVGYAAVLWSPYHDFNEVAALASARSQALRSSFRPTYNMAVNLVRRYRRDDAVPPRTFELRPVFERRSPFASARCRRVSARSARLSRRMADDRGGRAARRSVPRLRPPHRRGDRCRPLRWARCAEPRRVRFAVHLRSASTHERPDVAERLALAARSRSSAGSRRVSTTTNGRKRSRGPATSTLASPVSPTSGQGAPSSATCSARQGVAASGVATSSFLAATSSAT